jgi:hypothetical protein
LALIKCGCDKKGFDMKTSVKVLLLLHKLKKCKDFHIIVKDMTGSRVPIGENVTGMGDVG